ncbi:kinase domain protein [Ancylostoma ceylanicum]|uniref:non-specific serine/threonine protein kinase n=1 Tax=Ancylostoma ceylanicum TaxID=53326 RepID=A0A0D6LBS0_9BILA|nr:kinase domain protein [Ancylostoma ceylanicum]
MYVYDKERSYFEQCFREMRILGRGLFGEALEVECLETGNHYAVKRALRTFESAGARQQKLREATNHEAIPPHANIVRFEKAWEERGRLYIQTELCGANLADYRSEFGILTEAELWKVLHDMVQALHHMHSTGMLHMDVKPSNIFIANDSTCKLGDFGLAFDINKASRDAAEEGDKYYMAPEILNDAPTSAADMYSLGVSMLELATDVNLREHSHRIRNGELDAQLFGRDEIHPPSIRFSKLRKPLRNFFRDDISDAADSVKSHLPPRAATRRREKLTFPVKKLDFSDESDVSPGPAPKRIREAV